MQNNEENLISIDDIIFRTKKRGVDFGKGDPRERLRYLTKIGLLPYAKRKSFVSGQPPNGAYPEYVIELLEEIDKKLKAGKSIQELKKEKERKNLIEDSSYAAYTPPVQEERQEEIKEVQAPTKEAYSSPVETQFSGDRLENLISKATSIFKVGFLFLILGGIIFFFAGQAAERDFYSYLFASFDQIQRFTQGPALTDEEMPVVREVFISSTPEPYLTINAETDINGPLNVKEQITAPTLNLIEDEFKGTLISAGLTSDRTYAFPDQSGIICLSTGNCIFETKKGKVSSVGAIANRLTKFLSSNEIGVSSIEDFYTGVALTIDSAGNVGIGTFTPRAKLEVDGNLITTGRIGIDISDPAYSLHVNGRIQATGDICTDLVGGRCLSTLPLGGGGGRAGIGGSGTAGRLPIWTAGTTLGDSIISQSGSIIDVAGTVKMISFQMPTGAIDGLVLTVDDDGIGTWQPIPPVIIPGQSGQTLRYEAGEGWIGNYFLYNTGSAIGIGTTSTLAALTLSGDAIFTTTNLPQLALRYDDDNYLEFAIDDEQSLIEASKRLVLNSLTGEIRLGENVNFFNALGADVWGATFISTSTDSTVRKSGELVFRASIPIFRYSVPSQTSSTTDTQISRYFSLTDSLDSTAPAQLPGASRVYAFLINFADDIVTTSSSYWRVYRPSADEEFLTFEFPGQDLDSLEVGNPYLTATTTLPEPEPNDWRLDVRSPLADRTIRIFNIFLLVFDQID